MLISEYRHIVVYKIGKDKIEEDRERIIFISQSK